ncbi:MAG: hypothetical protein SV765_07680 [Pseudomonadota bacterium]|nr:hypothetical protein [Pseudomonadales bacterium]MDY6920077.1 hypothetical protein [Pseudomonadota bacterium]
MKLKLPAFDIFAYWGWLHWAIIALVVIISVKEVYENQVARLSRLDQQNVEVIEENIQEFNTMAERLAQLEVLPPVKNQWQYIPAIARRYGVEVSVLNKSDRMYNGPLKAWHGKIEGQVGAVLVAALEIQKTVPTFLYQIAIDKGEAQLGFSVLGSE